VVHWMIGVHLIDQPDLIRFPTVNAQSDGPVHCTGLPPSMNQIMLLGSDARLISGIKCSHSRPSP
jgi:hypothetical protein